MASLVFAPQLTKIELCLLIFVLALTAFPITCLILLLLSYRNFVILLAKIIRPDLLTILSPVSTLHTVPDRRVSMEGPATIVAYFLGIEGSVSLDEIKRAFAQRVLESHQNQSGELTYPELRQYLVHWMGFQFWKQEDAFSLDNHINHYTGSTEFKNIIRNTVRRPFDSKTSPWRMEVLYDYSPKDGSHSLPNTFCIFSVDHALTDGNTVMRILFEDFAASEVTYIGGITQQNIDAVTQTTTAATKPRPGKSVLKMLLAHFDLICGMYILSTRRSPWNHLTAAVEPALGKCIHTKVFHNVKKNSTFAATNLMIYTTAIRKLLQEGGASIPETIPCFYPVPIPGSPHPRKLVNHHAVCIMQLPVGIENQEERLSFIKQNLERQKELGLPGAMSNLMWLSGILPRWFLSATPCPTTLSNVAGPTNMGYFNGKPITSFCPTGYGRTDYGISCMIISYNGKVRIYATMNKGVEITTATSVQNLIQNMEKGITE